MDLIVKDSSIWRDSIAENLAETPDSIIRVGVVKETRFIKELDDYRYTVEVWDNNSKVPINCILNSRFGGIYNYEEFVARGFNTSNDAENINTHSANPGDHVLVMYAYGDPREGLIISQLKHPARLSKIKPDNNIDFESEFNGWNTSITSKGGYKVTQKLTPTNISELEKPPEGQKLPEPEYDNDNAKYATFYEFTEDGSYTLSDNTQEDSQLFRINKPDGTIDIISGKIEMQFNKKQELTFIRNKKTDVVSSDEFKVTTGGTSFKTTPDMFDLSATDIKSKGKWDQTGDTKIAGNQEVSGDVEVGGSFDSTGVTNLAGGANPLIYDIVLTIGTGNLGAPVVSNNVVLKTVQTKAT